MVVCSSSKSVEVGTLCDHILSQGVEAESCSRKIDISNCICVFEFKEIAEADAMCRAVLPNISTNTAKPYYWAVKSLDSNHSGHSEPHRECEKILYLTYSMKLTAKAMADSNCSASDIADYLSSRGCTGTLTDKRLKYHLDDVRKDLEDFAAIPKPGESEAAALLRVLNERNCRFIYFGQRKNYKVGAFQTNDYGKRQACHADGYFVGY